MKTIKNNIPKLYLHGIRHIDVKKILDKFIYDHINYNEIDIITGYSEKMKDIVIETIKDYGYKYHIGDDVGINNGFIKITI